MTKTYEFQAMNALYNIELWDAHIPWVISNNSSISCPGILIIIACTESFRHTSKVKNYVLYSIYNIHLQQLLDIIYNYSNAEIITQIIYSKAAI